MQIPVTVGINSRYIVGMVELGGVASCERSSVDPQRQDSDLVMTLIVRPNAYLRTTICPRSSLEDAVRSLGPYRHADRLLPRTAASMSPLQSCQTLSLWKS